jgi:hypothetical protein
LAGGWPLETGRAVTGRKENEMTILYWGGFAVLLAAALYSLFLAAATAFSEEYVDQKPMDHNVFLVVGLTCLVASFFLVYYAGQLP